MASFDFIKASLDGIRFAYAHRTDLFKFAFPILFVGVFCSLLVIHNGLERDILRSGLVQLPVFFAQGYFLSELVRYALFGEAFVYWGYTRRSRVEEYAQTYRERQLDVWRKRRVQGGMIIYVLFTVVSNGLLGGLKFVAEQNAPPETRPPPAALELADMPVFILESAAFLLVMMAVVWLVRVGFIYIAFSGGYGVKDYFRQLRGLYSSVSLFMSSALIALVMLAPLIFLIFVFEGFLRDTPGLRIVFLVILLELYKLIVLIVSTVACSYGIRDMFGGLPREGAGEQG